MRSKVEAKLAELRAQKEQLLGMYERIQADLNAVTGGIEVLEGLLTEAPVVELVDSPDYEDPPPPQEEDLA